MKPTTCAEAAVIFRRWADKTVYEHEFDYYKGIAETLEAFGNAPVPEKILADWNWERSG